MISPFFDKEQFKLPCVNSSMNLKKLNGMEMNQNQKNTGKGYSEAIQDKEKKLVASMK
jgi:hypothetical protein